MPTSQRCSSVYPTIFVRRKNKTNYLSNQTWVIHVISTSWKNVRWRTLYTTVISKLFNYRSLAIGPSKISKLAGTSTSTGSAKCPLSSVIQAYTQPYSFGGRIKLIICQIRHESFTKWWRTLYNIKHYSMYRGFSTTDSKTIFAMVGEPLGSESKLTLL